MLEKPIQLHCPCSSITFNIAYDMESGMCILDCTDCHSKSMVSIESNDGKLKYPTGSQYI